MKDIVRRTFVFFFMNSLNLLSVSSCIIIHVTNYKFFYQKSSPSRCVYWNIFRKSLRQSHRMSLTSVGFLTNNVLFILFSHMHRLFPAFPHRFGCYLRDHKIFLPYLQIFLYKCKKNERLTHRNMQDTPPCVHNKWFCIPSNVTGVILLCLFIIWSQTTGPLECIHVEALG